METEQSSQHQHAQWLASLATEHFVQQSLSSVAKDSAHQRGKSEPAEEDDSHIVDMSRHTVVKLAMDAADAEAPPPEASATGSPFNLRRNLKKRKIEHDEPERHEFKLIRPKERASAKGFDMRRPVRPIDRQKMRPWLKNLLDTGSVFGLNWLHREEGVFQISWRHASRLGWNLETDGDVFERWARHTGIFKDGDEPEPKRWKANFRCALHSLPDVKELTSPTDRKGRNASRTYRFLRPNEVQPPVKRKQRYNIQIPFAVYETQASEDSGSQHADSDDRNSDEEAVVPEKIQAFPHCDHDYAVRWGKPTGEQTSAEILSRHNSGYVLIKSKDAHEIEFRLTPPQSVVQSSGTKRTITASKSPSPQKKGKVNKKKPASATPVKKSKGKAGQKTALKKDGKPVKRMKKASEKSGEPSPATKVSLKALLSGRKNAAGAKKAKGGQTASLASKKVKRLKKPASPRAKRNNKTQGMNSRTSSSVQPQGLDVLLEAANQIEGMSKTRTSAPPAAPAITPQTIPRRAPRPKVAASQPSPKPSAPPPQNLSAQLSQKPSTVRSKTIPTSQFIVPNVGTPIVLTAHPMVGARTTGAAAFTSIPVVASVQAVGAPAPVQSQVSLGVLQKFLGLSTMQTIPASSVPMTLVPGQVLTGPIITTTKAEVKKSSLKHAGQKPAQAKFVEQKPANQKPVDQNSPSKKKGKVAGVPQNVGSVSPVPAVPTLVTQPEGTSMLKHLLRLTGPSMNVSTIPIATTTTAPITSHTIPALPQVTPSSLHQVTTAASHTIPTLPPVTTPSLSQLFTAAGLTMKEPSAAEQSVSKTETENDSVGTGENSVVDSVNQSGQNDDIKQEAGSPMETSVTESGDNSSDANKQENSSQDLDKPVPLKIEETPESLHAASNLSFIVPVSSTGTPETSDTDGLQSSGGEQPCAPPQIMTPATVCFTQATVPPQLTASSVPQVTLCLPQAVLGPQTQQVSSDGAQTMTVTLPQGAVPTLQGHNQGGSVATFTHSMDLLQFLNLCAASGNGQVIIKTEPPPPTDVSAASNVHVSDQAAMSSQGRGETSAVPSYAMVNPCETVNSADTAVIRGSPPDLSEEQALASAIRTASIAAVSSPALTVASESPALLPTIDSASLSATMDTSALSTAVQSLNTIDSATLSATVVDPSALAAAMQSSALSTSGDCPSVLSSAETQPDLATALTVVPASEEPISVPAVQQVTRAEMGLSGAHDTMTNQFVDEANLVAAMSADQQGADSFIVEDMLL